MPYPAKLARPLIVEVALTLLDAGGRAALGMRPVAEALGVRPASLYKHVGDVAGLETLLAEEIAAGLRESLERALDAPPSPGSSADVLRRLGEAYARFAREHPARYALLVAVPAPADAAAPENAERKALWNRLLDVVAPLTDDGDDTGAAVVVWAFLHGYAALDRSGLFGASGPQGALHRGLAALAAGLASDQPTRNSSSDRA
jgi:AcrR family transcriptional regulator